MLIFLINLSINQPRTRQPDRKLLTYGPLIPEVLLFLQLHQTLHSNPDPIKAREEEHDATGGNEAGDDDVVAQEIERSMRDQDREQGDWNDGHAVKEDCVTVSKVGFECVKGL